MFLPLQGGGQKGDGVFVGVPLVQRPNLWVKISFPKGEANISSFWPLARRAVGQREAGRDFQSVRVNRSLP